MDDLNQSQSEEAPTTAPDELSMLKQRAKLLGLTFSNNIGLDALREKVNSKITGDEPKAEEDVAESDLELSERQELEELRAFKRAAAASEAETLLNPLAGDTLGAKPASKMSVREATLKEAMKLVRLRITNLDPKKKDLRGEILCVGNGIIGMVKKFIPYGEMTDDGFHVPNILYQELESRKFLHIQTVRNKQNGQIDVKTSYAKEFSLEILPMLTTEELGKLAAIQAAASASS